MIKLNVEFEEGENKIFNIKNELKEITLGEFQEISNISDSDSGYQFEKLLNVILILSEDKRVVDYIYEDNFYEILEELKFNGIPMDMNSEYIINGKLFKIKLNKDGSDIFLYISQLSEIEKILINNPKNHLGKIMSILFKSEGMSNNHKEKFLKDHMTMDIAMPFISRLNIKVLENIKNLMEHRKEDKNNIIPDEKKD